MTTPHDPKKDPLHGITLERILTELVDQYGWKTLGERIPIGCFQREPSIASSLKFLRKTDWARKKVEELYLRMRRSQAWKHTLPTPPVRP